MLNKKIVLQSTAIIIAVCLLSLCTFKVSNQAALSSAKLKYSLQDIIIDPGHGGFDGGAIASDGTVEKNINLNISLMLKNLLQTQGFNVIMTRTSDSATDDTEYPTIRKRKINDLQNRLELMNSMTDAVYISVHLNKFTASSASGMQVFYSPNTEASKQLAEGIQSYTKVKLQPANNRVIKKGTKDTYLLYYAEIPAVIVECGFISNPSDLSLLKTEEYQSKLAFCIFAGILEYYNNETEVV